MSPRRGERPGGPGSTTAADRARLALLGAETPEGSRIREVLADRKVPGDRVDLFGRTRGEAVLSEYAGEARLIQEPETAELMRHDVVFLCESSDVARRILSLHAPETLVVDAAGCGADREDMPVVHMDINPEASATPGGAVGAPHGISAMLAELVHAVDSGPGVRRASAVVLRPAADFGDDGIEELREQTVRLFNFAEIPREVFGAQLAFNVVPERLRRGRSGELDRRVTREVRRIQGWDEPRLDVRIVNVPVFHGHAAFVRLETDRESDAETLEASLDAAAGIERTKDEAPATPLEVGGARRTVVADFSVEATGAHWVWIVAGELGRVTAEHAVRLAGTLRKL
jgi:aspartate-semialdehyde dehydrogenase